MCLIHVYNAPKRHFPKVVDGSSNIRLPVPGIGKKYRVVRFQCCYYRRVAGMNAKGQQQKTACLINGQFIGKEHALQRVTSIS